MVVILTPVVIALAQALKIAPSKLLIPLSYASILGGTTTLIGTSTNLLVDGVAQRMDMAPFSMFEITAPALLIALLGCGFMLLFARRWLPARETLTQQFGASADRLFMTELFFARGLAAGRPHAAGRSPGQRPDAGAQAVPR